MSRLLEVTFDFRLKRASLWRISLFVDSMGKVKSLPKKCRFSVKILKKPPHSSVTKMHFPSSIFWISPWRLASSRPPNCHPRARRDTPLMPLQIHKGFFSVDKMPELINLNDLCGLFWYRNCVRKLTYPLKNSDIAYLKNLGNSKHGHAAVSIQHHR